MWGGQPKTPIVASIVHASEDLFFLYRTMQNLPFMGGQDKDNYEDALKKNIVGCNFADVESFSRCTWSGAKNVILRLLTINPEERMSAAEVMTHGWLQVNAKIILVRFLMKFCLLHTFVLKLRRSSSSWLGQRPGRSAEPSNLERRNASEDQGRPFPAFQEIH